MGIITLKKIKSMKENDDVKKVYIDGNTMITKKAYDYAVERGIEMIHAKAPVINEKRMDVMKDPGTHFLIFLRKVRSRS